MAVNTNRKEVEQISLESSSNLKFTEPIKNSPNYFTPAHAVL